LGNFGLFRGLTAALLLLALLQTVNAATITGCTQIQSPGYYELASDITASGTCIVITSDHVTFDGKGHKISGTTGDGIFVVSQTVYNDPVYNYTNVIKNVSIQNVVVEGFDVGIHIRGAQGVAVTKSEILNSASIGIHVEFSDNALVYENVVRNADVGIKIANSFASDIAHNRVTGCNIGIYTAKYKVFYGDWPYIGLKNVYIYDNYLKNHQNIGGLAANPATDPGDLENVNLFTQKTPGTNIIGGPYFGGNFYSTPSGNGYSDLCVDADVDGLCDQPFNAGYLVDKYPLTYITAAGPDVTPELKPEKLVVVKPAEGESFCAGDEIVIEWTGGDEDWRVDLSLVDTLSLAMTPIASGIHNSGQYTWTIPATLSPGTYQIYIQEINQRDYAYGGKFFVIDCSQQATKGIEVPECEGIIDLSTGTTGNFIPDLYGAAEDSVNDPVDWEVEGMTAYVVPPYPGWYSGPEIDSIANWITPYTNQNHNYPQGYGDFKATLKFTAPANGNITLYYTADDGLDLYLDGNLVDSYKVYKGFTQLRKYETNVIAGQHVITASVEDEHRVVSGFLAIGWFCPTEVVEKPCERPQTVKLQVGEKYQCGDYVVSIEKVSTNGYATVTVYENGNLVGSYSVNLGQSLVVGGLTLTLKEMSENTVVLEVCCDEAVACENWREVELKISEKYQCGDYTIVLDNVDYPTQAVKVAVYDSSGNLLGIHQLSVGDSISQPSLVLTDITGDNSAKFKICCEELPMECEEKDVRAVIGQKYPCGDYYFTMTGLNYADQKVTISIIDQSGNILSTHTLGVGDTAVEGSIKITLSQITGDNSALFTVCCEKVACETWTEVDAKIREKYQCGEYTLTLNSVNYANQSVEISVYDSGGNLIATHQLSVGDSISHPSLVLTDITGDNSARFKVCCEKVSKAQPSYTTTINPEEATEVPATTEKGGGEVSATPGFEALIAVAGLLGVGYLLRRK